MSQPEATVAVGSARPQSRRAEEIQAILERNQEMRRQLLEGMADVGAEASQRAALGNTAAATATAVYALPVMNAISYRV
jgi:hypothetical protein